MLNIPMIGSFFDDKLICRTTACGSTAVGVAGNLEGNADFGGVWGGGKCRDTSSFPPAGDSL